jgi:hypothetical protein
MSQKRRASNRPSTLILPKAAVWVCAGTLTVLDIVLGFASWAMCFKVDIDLYRLVCLFEKLSEPPRFMAFEQWFEHVCFPFLSLYCCRYAR